MIPIPAAAAAVPVPALIAAASIRPAVVIAVDETAVIVAVDDPRPVGAAVAVAVCVPLSVGPLAIGTTIAVAVEASGRFAGAIVGASAAIPVPARTLGLLGALRLLQAARTRRLHHLRRPGLIARVDGLGSLGGTATTARELRRDGLGGGLRGSGLGRSGLRPSGLSALGTILRGVAARTGTFAASLAARR